MPKNDQSEIEALSAALGAELASAEGSYDDELSANRAQAMDYYHCKPRGDEQVGKSQVQSADVADMVNAALAMLVPMLSTDAVVEFEPNGSDDEAQVQSESDVVNAVIIEENHGFIEIQEAVKDALLLKNGCLKVWFEDKLDELKVPTEGLDELELAHLLTQEVPNETRELVGENVVITTTERTFKSASVAIERISYQANYCGALQDIRFFSELVPYTKSELLEMGVDEDLVDELSSTGKVSDGTTFSRDTVADEGDAATEDQQIVECSESYLLIDLDGDGISERYWILSYGDKVLDYEVADLIPYSLGSPFLNPHRITGESLFDHLKSIQDTKTGFQRQWMDNATVNNNGRYAYDPGAVNERDVLTPRAGGGIRARNPSQAIVPIPINDVGPSILAALQYQDQIRTERGGASLDLMSADAQLVGETAHGIERQYASREALSAMMAKNLSETLIRDHYVMMHEYLRRYSNKPRQVRLAGSWVEVNPSEWPERRRVNVTAGLSPGARGHLQSVFQQTIQIQLQLIQSGAGGQLADLQTLYRTVIDWQRMGGVDNPDSHWIDPASDQARAAAQASQQAAQQQRQHELQVMQLQVQLERQKLENDRLAKEGDLAWKYYDTDTDAELKAAQIGAQAVVDLEKGKKPNEQRSAAPGPVDGHAPN